MLSEQEMRQAQEEVVNAMFHAARQYAGTLRGSTGIFSVRMSGKNEICILFKNGINLSFKPELWTTWGSK